MIVLCRLYYESQRYGILFIGYDAVTLVNRPSGPHTSHGKAMDNQGFNPMYVPIGTHHITYKTPGNNRLPTGTRSLGLPIMTIR